MISNKFFIAASVLLVLLMTQLAQAGHGQQANHKTAVVLAMFGTTMEPALEGLLNIKRQISKAYPNTPIKIAFTSNIIRRIWQQRSADPEYIKNNSSIPAEILKAQGPLATIANLQDNGFDTIIVQPTHIALGEEFTDLSAYVAGLNSIKTIKPKFQPFHKLVISRPALGTVGSKHPYVDDITAVAESLALDAKFSAEKKAALVYMGHGNDYFPSGGPYLQFEDRMRTMYPNVKTYIGTVEGFPCFDNVLARLKKDQVKKVVLKPFMTVAGDHARNDMAGAEEDSWQSMLSRNNIEVIPVIRGLGEQNDFAMVFVSHLADAAADAGISLR